MKFIPEYSLKENLRRKCYFVICLITCFLVSLVCLVAKAVVGQGALIFLMLGEKDSGEMDFYLTSTPLSRNTSYNSLDDYHIDNAFFNFTKYGEIMTSENSKKEPNPFNTSTMRTYINGRGSNKNIYLMLIDTEREREIELGRGYPFGKLGEGECLVHSKLAQKDQKEYNMYIPLSNFLTNTLLYYYYDSQNITNETAINLENILNEKNFTLNFNCKIKDILEDNYGKESSDDDNLVIMEQEHFYKYISNFLPENINQYFPDFKYILQKEIKAEEYGNVLIVNFPKNRLNYYTESDYDYLLEKGVKYMNRIVEKLGTLQYYSVNMPLIKTMSKYKNGTTLLNLILNIILLGIFGLSLILIHSLLLITTETNSFEFGVLRLVGNSKKNIIFLIVFQCICFSIPAFIVALATSFGMLKIINNIIKKELNTNLNVGITADSFFFTFFMNFLAPIIAAIFPIRSILKKNIATSINTMLNKTSGVKIEIISLQKKEITSLIIFGLLTFIYGASIYYFLPLALVSMNFGLIGIIFLWILFGILSGFILLSQNIENLLQKILTYLLLFFTRSYTKLLILKNLAAHRLKNKKSSLMFSLSVGIFILASVGFDIILQSTKNMKVMQNGSEILIHSKDDEDYFYPEDIMISLMKLYQKNLIETFSLISVNLGSLCFDTNFYISNYGKTINSKQDIFSINSAYFSATTPQNLKIYKQNKNYKNFTPSEQLYLSEFRGKIGISAILTFEFNADLDSKIFLKTSKNNKEMQFLSQPAFILDSAGGLQMNSQPSMRVTRDAIISFPQYLDILQKCRNYFSEESGEFRFIGYKNLPIWGVNIKTKDLVTEKEVKEISNIVKYYGPANIDLWLLSNLNNRLGMISNIVFLIFYIISSVVLIFCLFNLTASMTINIYEQKKEIAIMRSLGMKRRHVIFVYIAEAFILILSSSIIGTIVGSIISYTMALQWGIFTNVNVAFTLPTGSIIVIVIISIIGGIFSTYIPARNMLNKSIAELIKSI